MVSRCFANTNRCSRQPGRRIDAFSIELLNNGLPDELRTVAVIQFFDCGIYMVDEFGAHRNRYQLLSIRSFSWHGVFFIYFLPGSHANLSCTGVYNQYIVHPWFAMTEPITCDEVQRERAFPPKAANDTSSIPNVAPRWVRSAQLPGLFCSWDLAYRCTKSGWLKPVVQGKRRTIYRLADVLNCMRRIEAGEIRVARSRRSVP